MHKKRAATPVFRVARGAPGLLRMPFHPSFRILRKNGREKEMSRYLAGEAETGFSLKIISSVRTTVRPEESGEMIMTTFRSG